MVTLDQKYVHHIPLSPFSCVAYINLFPHTFFFKEDLIFLMFIFEKESAHEQGRGRERGRQRI